MCAVNPFVGIINTALDGTLDTMGEGSRIALGIAVAAMMAVDMGGPVNKAAYVFATSTLAAAMPAVGTSIMACAMVGGMVPPLAIALCCTFFPSRFYPAERRSGLVNYIMGLCFITEGVIPFAASDPARVIPACVTGSAPGRRLVAFFNCTLPAPHGGIFVFPCHPERAGLPRRPGRRFPGRYAGAGPAPEKAGLTLRQTPTSHIFVLEVIIMVSEQLTVCQQGRVPYASRQYLCPGYDQVPVQYHHRLQRPRHRRQEHHERDGRLHEAGR